MDGFQWTEIPASHGNHVTAKLTAAGPDSSFVQVPALLSGGDTPSPSAPLSQCVTHFAIHLLILACFDSTDGSSHSAVRYLSEEEV